MSHALLLSLHVPCKDKEHSSAYYSFSSKGEEAVLKNTIKKNLTFCCFLCTITTVKGNMNTQQTAERGEGLKSGKVALPGRNIDDD